LKRKRAKMLNSSSMILVKLLKFRRLNHSVTSNSDL
jgi:hypothetical protein